MLIIKDDWVHQYTRIMVDDYMGSCYPSLEDHPNDRKYTLW